ncbi:MLO-like protein 13 isoform X2 [Phragmites australis]|uniref:MLO-like protein 13 isoform X2 n=1 Tax=Phragmites australis TaxID=29695 RepID=UPI002D773077|nr:MLO-like protein 13 isoform X2 [Phragmites australis]
MGEEASLAHTPTWVVAAVCLAIVSVSLAAERFLHYLGKSLKHKEQKTLYSALQRLKEEAATHFMLPCKKENPRAAEQGAKFCKQKGYVPLLSLEALYQLHIFIFVLGLVHVVFCATTILLGGAKMRKWKHWETGIHREIEEKLWKAGYERKVTPLNVVLHRNQGKFVSERTQGFLMKLAVVSWIIAFLKQFYNSVSKSDYEALRSAFVWIHYPKKPDFDFHKYMIRALEHDFKRVVGISWYLWLFVIFFLLLNINGWHTYFWLAFLPIFLLLIVGAKLEHIITRLAQDAAASLSDGTEGSPKIKPSKEHFWFHKPGLVLHLIHFILFQNSFEIGFFFWVLVSEGFSSCMMERKAYAISRLVIGVIIEVVCSYITLPLYAIVTHMGGDIKLQAFGSDVHDSVQSWATGALRKKTLAPDERLGSSRATLTRTPPPDLDEIVSIDDGGHGHDGRS